MKQFGIRLNDFDSSGKAIFVAEFEDFLLDLERLVVAEADDRGHSLEKRFINGDVGLGIDGEVSQVEELNDSGLLEGLIVEAVASQLFFHQLTGSQFGKRSFALLLLHDNCNLIKTIFKFQTFLYLLILSPNLIQIIFFTILFSTPFILLNLIYLYCGVFS